MLKVSSLAKDGKYLPFVDNFTVPFAGRLDLNSNSTNASSNLWNVWKLVRDVWKIENTHV